MCQGVPLIQEVLEFGASITKVSKYLNAEAENSEEEQTCIDRNIGMSSALIYEQDGAKSHLSQLIISFGLGLLPNL